LVFAQRYVFLPLSFVDRVSSSFLLDVSYASDLTPDQKDALLDVIRATSHPQITSEIRRELVNSVVVRGMPREPDDQDVVMS